METQDYTFPQTNVCGEVTISYHATNISYNKRIQSPKDAADILRSIWNDKLEHIESAYMLMMAQDNSLLGYSFIGMGGITGCIIDPRVVFQTALLSNACSIILAHNHPSGNPVPSSSDRKITSNIYKVGESLSIRVLDHIILTLNDQCSMAEKGIMTELQS